ncbi:hypothetical protein TREPR_2370 [Treponema primitia ZAS-2]|uniref:Capsule assembly protein Wzi n=1 Tax=Treponema primitia (strain ATCC BAA-887 / DSM 12427 / ZAS-2) TaxID=545694 RepID=F5YHK9_TREPZ|nr:capsule assembly Wzi family protein [Treponema primitia]AEF85693.1 hypothetical protein TREPR_2370 [Treponema primitia ZAS-2]
MWYKLNLLNHKTLIVLFILTTVLVTAQEALVSDTEQYYDFLALQGLSERPYLNFRTLSDSSWIIDKEADHPWKNNNLGTRRNLTDKITLKIFGPELFNSYNTATPYGQNDGALWQGKGYNGSFTGGARLEAYGVELTFKPQLAFSQNAGFEYMSPAYTGDNYKDKAAKYGYYGVPSIDAPQRFGDDPFFIYDWGDSEVRYTWKTLTIGFGTQAIWLGPARLNPIIHSNNAASYPKLDIGLRKQRMVIPKLNWYLGDIETRAWMGYLSESNWFDNDSSNDHNLITGFSIAYGVPFLSGLSIGFNRIMLSKWNAMNYEAITTILWPFMEIDAGYDENDQRASVIIDYILPIAGLDIFFEWGKNDFSPNFDHFLRYPFHTEGYTVGIKKSVPITNTLKGEILLEITNLECSQDYDRLINWYSTFYAHHIITQGHTNQGQWLGAGIGTGGNSQYLGFKLYYPKGYGNIFLQRRNPDLDHSYFIESRTYGNAEGIPLGNIRAFLDIGISGLYYINHNMSISSSLVFRDEHNPLSKSISFLSSSHRYNVYITTSLKYSF